MQEPINQEVIPANQPSFGSLLGKWFRFLFPVSVAGLALTLLSAFDFASTAVSILSSGITLCITIALFSMAPANRCYRTAAIFCAVTFAAGLLSDFADVTWLSLPLSVCSIIASYMEYKGHAQVISPHDPTLSQKWSSLFVWQLVVGLISGSVTAIITMISVLVGAGHERIVTVVLLITIVSSSCVRLVYLLYLKKMQSYFPK